MPYRRYDGNFLSARGLPSSVEQRVAETEQRSARTEQRSARTEQ
jgi:hypothetical protein